MLCAMSSDYQRKEVISRLRINVLPQRNGFQINPAKFFICERPKHSPGVKLPGGYSRPALPSSVFNRPKSCLPIPKPAAKKIKQEDVQLKYFMEKDTIRSITEFDPEKRTAEKYNNVVTSRQKYVHFHHTRFTVDRTDHNTVLFTMLVSYVHLSCCQLTRKAHKFP